jgi:phospholipid/cholesterol/gamma-HCH transport system permease protein
MDSTQPSAGERLKAGLDELGDIGRWILRTTIELPAALRYPQEILRQTAILLLSNAIPIWSMLLVFGVFIGELGYYTLTQIGAQAYMGLFAAAGTLKATNPVFFGFVVAAKTGTGFVAELGAMRINDEIDALEVLGVPPRAYLVGTRVWASMIALPMLYMTGLGISFTFAWYSSTQIYNAVSSGGFLRVFWSFVSPFDLALGSMGWAMSTAFFAVIVGCYYGYFATGGAVGVGENAAKSMSLNVVIVALASGLVFQAIYGTGVVLPIGN